MQNAIHFSTTVLPITHCNQGANCIKSVISSANALPSGALWQRMVTCRVVGWVGHLLCAMSHGCVSKLKPCHMVLSQSCSHATWFCLKTACVALGWDGTRRQCTTRTLTHLFWNACLASEQQCVLCVCVNVGAAELLEAVEKELLTVGFVGHGLLHGQGLIALRAWEPSKWLRVSYVSSNTFSYMECGEATSRAPCKSWHAPRRAQGRLMFPATLYWCAFSCKI